MFEDGDIVVYVNKLADRETTISNHLTLYTKYTIIQILMNGTIKIKEYPNCTFSCRRFILLSKYRKQKLKKICSRLETK